MQSKTLVNKSAEKLNIAVIVSDYHDVITHSMAKAALATFIEAGGIECNCPIHHVTGAWELPVLAKTLSSNPAIDGIVALGCILTGETTHDRIIGQAIADGLMSLSIDWGKPISMGVLTCQTIEQAKSRAGGDTGNKGVESMHAAINTAWSIKDLKS